MGTTETVEMGLLSSLESQSSGDETDFITGRKREKRQRSKQPGEGDALNEDAKIFIRNAYKLADRNIVRRLIVNAAFVGSWYLFSVSISIVSIRFFLLGALGTDDTDAGPVLVQQMDVL
jgi:solute carrier family 35, member C2